ncbi:MAG: type II toxin-antitoxin system VapC family toxin [bacterium]
MRAFLDTSSLLKLYHHEIGSDAIEDALLSDVEEIFLSDIAILEFRSAIWKKVRKGEINEKVAIEVISYFQDDYHNFQWIKIQFETLEAASKLLMKYGHKGLRTLDSLQLASALTLKNDECIFLTSDNLLKSLFKEESLHVT